ncbi:acyl-CoA dehydrogenase family protein [Nocardia alba]|uniref:acyl-CoA dehydrogenase family protein n=1 Tax=Nocardia alba TaxID=225051 RepID=UPI00082BED83|nr:acyl-CoA dehydrogenase family protein [Nocardia alba]
MTTAVDLPSRFVRFAIENLAGSATELDQAAEHPLPQSQRFAEVGLANWWLAAEFGGLGIGMESSVDIVSEMAYHDTGFTFGSFLPILGTTMIERFAHPDVARRVLSQLGVAGHSCAILASEQQAGSDLTQTATTYRGSADGARLTLNGQKYFATNADRALYHVVLARDIDDGSEYRMIVVPRDTPGVRIHQRWSMTGVRGSATYEVALENVTVPVENMLHGNGIRVLEVGLNLSRTLIAACGIGIARRIRDLSMTYAQTTLVGGRPLHLNDVFAAKLGQMEAHIETMRTQCLAAGREIDELLARGGSADPLRQGTLRSAMVAKLFCGQITWQVASIGSEIFGGGGYTRDHPIGKLVRDARYIGVVEGGEDVTRALLYARYVKPASRRR